MDASTYVICVNHDNYTFPEFRVSLLDNLNGWEGMSQDGDLVFFAGNRPADVFVQIEKYISHTEGISVQHIIRKLLQNPIKKEWGKRFARS